MVPQAPEPQVVAHFAGSALILPVPKGCTSAARMGPYAQKAPQRVRLLARFNGNLVVDMDLAGMKEHEVRVRTQMQMQMHMHGLEHEHMHMCMRMHKHGHKHGHGHGHAQGHGRGHEHTHKL